MSKQCQNDVETMSKRLENDGKMTVKITYFDIVVAFVVNHPPNCMVVWIGADIDVPSSNSIIFSVWSDTTLLEIIKLLTMHQVI